MALAGTDYPLKPGQSTNNRERRALARQY